MKEFIRTLKETFLINVNEFLQYGLIPLAGGIFGIIIVLIVMAVDGTGEDYGQIGTMLVQMFGMILLFFGGIFSVQSDFNLAVSMGKTRKYYVPSKYLMLVCETAVILIIMFVISRIEDILYPAIYPGAVCDLNVGGIFGYPGILAGVLFGLPMIVLLFGALLMRFAAKFFWVIWVLWMFLCMGVPRIASAASENPDTIPGKIGRTVIEFFSGFTSLKLLGLAAVVIAAGLAITFALFRKQRVTA